MQNANTLLIIHSGEGGNGNLFGWLYLLHRLYNIKEVRFRIVVSAIWQTLLLPTFILAGLGLLFPLRHNIPVIHPCSCNF